LKNILGTWKGCIGNNLVSVRFEFTSESKNLLVYFTVCAPPMAPFDRFSIMNSNPETLASKVYYNRNTNTLFIEDCVLGPMTVWVVNNTIIGKLTNPEVNINLVKM